MDLTDIVKARAEEMLTHDERMLKHVQALKRSLVYPFPDRLEPGKVEWLLSEMERDITLSIEWENERTAMYQGPPEDEDFTDPFAG